MTLILIQGARVLGADPVVGDGAWEASGLTVPFHIAPDAAIVEVGELPDDFVGGEWLWEGGGADTASSRPAAAARRGPHAQDRESGQDHGMAGLRQPA